MMQTPEKDLDTGAESVKEDAPVEEVSEEQIWNEFDAKDREDTADAASLSDQDGPGADDIDADPEDDAHRSHASDASDEPNPSEDNGDADNADGDDVSRLKAENDELRNQLHSSIGRNRGDARRIDQLTKERDALRKAKAARSSVDDDARKARREKLDEAREEYGDVIGPMAEEVDEVQSRLDQMSARDDARVQEIDAEIAETVQAQTDVFTQAHPDGFDVLRKHGTVFKQWIEDQPKRIRDLHESNFDHIVDGEGAAEVLGLFKEALAEAESANDDPPDPQQRLSKKREQQLRGAQASDPGTKRKAVTDTPAGADDPQAHWDHFERLDRQQAKDNAGAWG